MRRYRYHNQKRFVTRINRYPFTTKLSLRDPFDLVERFFSRRDQKAEKKCEGKEDGEGNIESIRISSIRL